MESAHSADKAESANTRETKRSSDKRSTRSQARRQTRADSHDSADTTSEGTNTAYKLDKKEESGAAYRSSMEAVERMLDVPRSLVIRKQNASRASSSNSPNNEAPQPPPRSPARKDGPSPQHPSPESPLLAPRPLKTPLIPAATTSSRTNTSSTTTSPTPDQPPKNATMKERLAFARTTRPASPPPPPDEVSARKVSVRPPIFDPNLGICQWTSALPSTSRPDQMWEWPKRWTCCRCEGMTIVEQKCCANLECGHWRCPRECLLVKVARPLGQFVGVDGGS